VKSVRNLGGCRLCPTPVPATHTTREFGEGWVPVCDECYEVALRLGKARSSRNAGDLVKGVYPGGRAAFFSTLRKRDVFVGMGLQGVELTQLGTNPPRQRTSMRKGHYGTGVK